MLRLLLRTKALTIASVSTCGRGLRAMTKYIFAKNKFILAEIFLLANASMTYVLDK